MTDDAASSGEQAQPEAAPGAVVREIPIINKRGLHARASAKFVKMVEQFDAEVIALRRKGRIQQIEETGPRGEVLRIVEACDLVAMPIERDAAADIDAGRRRIARYADGFQDGG